MINYRVTSQEYIIDYKENEEKGKPYKSNYKAEDLKDLLKQMGMFNDELTDEEYELGSAEAFLLDIEDKIKNDGGFWDENGEICSSEPERYEYICTATWNNVDIISDEELEKEKKKKLEKKNAKKEKSNDKWDKIMKQAEKALGEDCSDVNELLEFLKTTYEAPKKH